MVEVKNEIAATVTMPTLMVASIATGFALCETTFSRMQEAISIATGLDIFTHEMGHGPTMALVSEHLHGRFPKLPTKDECNKDWKGAARKATDAYGDTMTFVPGKIERESHPFETLNSMMTSKASPNLPSASQEGGE